MRHWIWDNTILAALKKQRQTSLLAATTLVLLAFLLSPSSQTYFDPRLRTYLHELRMALWWFLCGVLATVGLGCGVQTGALFLFPHVVQVALDAAAASSERSEQRVLVASFWPGFWAGFGSAAGELVPFLLARTIKRAGGDPFSLLASEEENADNEEEGSENAAGSSLKKQRWTPKLLLANTRRAMERQLSTGSFWKITFLAAIPNALFDLCGLVCGGLDLVPLPTFFFAVFVAKALLRTPLQTCALAMAVYFAATVETKQSDEEEESATWLGGLVSLLREWGKQVIDQLKETDDDENETRTWSWISIIKMLWTLVAVALLVAFVMSTVEQIAQHYAKSLKQNKTTKPKEEATAGEEKKTK